MIARLLIDHQPMDDKRAASSSAQWESFCVVAYPLDKVLPDASMQREREGEGEIRVGRRENLVGEKRSSLPTACSIRAENSCTRRIDI